MVELGEDMLPSGGNVTFEVMFPSGGNVTFGIVALGEVRLPSGFIVVFMMLPSGFAVAFAMVELGEVMLPSGFNVVFAICYCRLGAVATKIGISDSFDTHGTVCCFAVNDLEFIVCTSFVARICCFRRIFINLGFR